MQDYLVQFEIHEEVGISPYNDDYEIQVTKDHMVVPVENDGLDISEVEEYTLEYIAEYLEIDMEDIHIFDVVRINKNVDIEDLLVDDELPSNGVYTL